MADRLPRECEKLREKLVEQAAARLGGRDAAALNQHLAVCERCRAELADLRAVMRAVQAIGPAEAPPDLVPRVRRAVHGQVAAPQPVRHFWTRIAAPAAIVTGIIAVSFALHPAVRERARHGAVEGEAMHHAAAPEKDALQPRRPLLPPAGQSRVRGVPSRDAPAVREEAGGPAPTEPARLGYFEPLTQPEMSGGPRRGGPAQRQAKARREGARAPGKEETLRDAAPASEPRSGRGGGGGGGFGGASRGGPLLGDVAEAPAPRDEALDRWAEREAGIADMVVQQETPPLPVDATVVLARGADRSVVGIAVVAQQPVPEVEVNVGGGGQRRQLWQGAPPTPGAVMLREEDTGPGPAAIPVQIASPAGRRDYTLFLPVMARLGESAATAPVGRLEGETLSELLARFSALTGLVILAEEPLSATVSGEIPPGPPRASLEQVAAGAGLQVEQGDELAITLTQRRSPQ